MGGGWGSASPETAEGACSAAQEGNGTLPRLQAEDLRPLLPLLVAGPLRRRLPWPRPVSGMPSPWTSREGLPGSLFCQSSAGPPLLLASVPLKGRAWQSLASEPSSSTSRLMGCGCRSSGCAQPGGWAGEVAADADSPVAGLRPLLAAQAEALSTELQAMFAARLEEVLDRKSVV